MQLSFSKAVNFSLIVSKTDETCRSNGSLTFSVLGTAPGTTIVYNIYVLPNTSTPVATVSTNTYSGLAAGNYRIIATATAAGVFTTQQQDITILNQIIPLNYQITSQNVICGNDGKMTINVRSGTAVSYEIISGPIIRPLQNSNVFSNLTAGQYTVRVFDDCGEGVVQTNTISTVTPNIVISNVGSGNPVGCSLIPVNFTINPTNPAPATSSVAFPLQVQIKVFPPAGGSPIIYNQLVNSAIQPLSISENVVFYNNQPYLFDIKITDNCGNIYVSNNHLINKSITASTTIFNPNCTGATVLFANISELTVTAAPAAYPFTVPYNLTSEINSTNGAALNLPIGSYIFSAINSCGIAQIFTIDVSPTVLIPALSITQNCGIAKLSLTNVYSVLMTSAPANYSYTTPHDFTNLIATNNVLTLTDVPNGFYSFIITNSCGTTSVLSTTVNISTVLQPAPVVIEGCTNGFGGVLIAGNFSVVKVISAPNTYVPSVPHDVSNLINGIYNHFVMDNLPAGNYTIQTTLTCGTAFNVPVTINGYSELNNTSIVPLCGAFNINLQYSSNNNPYQYWLQKLNPVTNQWVHPLTGVAFTTNYSTTTAIPLTNNAINYNFAFVGTFRIVGISQIYLQGNRLFYFQDCAKDIMQFSFFNQPKINDVYTFSCTNGSYDTVVDADGIAPLVYRITQKNGQAFVIQNGNSNTFLRLAPASYNFQVEDACGNILNIPYDIPRPTQFVLTPSSFCAGNNGSLTLPNFPFLQYQWWKDNNTSTILSTTSSLQFTPFNISQTGVYHVRVSYPSNPLLCINSVISYTITGTGNFPNSGTGTTTNYCGNQGIIDLFTKLAGSYDSGGTWTEVTSSSTLLNNLWNSTAVPSGTYRFKYKVIAACGSIAESFVNITINPIPATPIATSNATVCVGQSINLSASTVPSATYSWTGPNGFTSNLQNPTINTATLLNAGTYSVKASINGCDSAQSTVVISVTLVPQFEISASCVSNRMTAIVRPIANSFNPNTAIYNWTGPNGFLAAGNPIDITAAAKGLYSLTVIDAGCGTTNSIDILYTACQIPKGVSANNDGRNDAFDLSGFGNIPNLKIYNRYGKIVFDYNNYTNQWHGQDSNNNQLPDATYYYYLKLDSGQQKTGWVYLAH